MNLGLSLKNQKSEKNYLNIKVRKSYAVGESKNAVLFEFDTNDYEQFYVWINKWAIYTSEYTDILDISLVDGIDFKYSIYRKNNNDWKKPDAKISASDLKNELLKDSAIAEINRK